MPSVSCCAIRCHMDFQKCKICGERHPVQRGGCPSSQSRGGGESRPAADKNRLGTGQIRKATESPKGRPPPSAGVAPGPRAMKSGGGVGGRHAERQADDSLLAGREKLQRSDERGSIRRRQVGAIQAGPQSPKSATAGVTPSPRAFRKPLAKDADKTLMATKPWEAEGMSRRTWYRRRAEARKKSDEE